MACLRNQDDGDLKLQGCLRTKPPIFMFKNEESHILVFKSLMSMFLLVHQTPLCPQCQRPVSRWEALGGLSCDPHCHKGCGIQEQ